VEEAKNEIFEMLDREERQRRAEQEYIERLRNELYYEEFEENERAKDEARRIEQERITRELMAANEYQAQLKAERKAKEEEEEREFRTKMLQKFAEDERLDQMNAQKRRMRELEHKRQADMLWKQKLQMQREERAKEEEARLVVMLEERRKAEIIEQERRRLLAEHASAVADYLPKGTLKTEEDRQLVYRNPY
jgi:hypothetical protein